MWGIKNMKNKYTIAIICAMEEELASITSSLDLQLTAPSLTNKFNVQRTEFNGHQLIFLLCGIGKVNAAMSTQYIIDTFSPEYIINVGVAGGLLSSLAFGDVVVAEDLVQYDVDVTAFGMPLGQIPRLNTFSFACDAKLLAIANTIKNNDFNISLGRIISGDQFIDDEFKARKLHEQFSALACEMEGAALAQVCYLNKVPFLVIRALSDMAGQTKKDNNKDAATSFKELKDMVADRSSLIVKELLKNI